MLVLSRRRGESLTIGDGIRVTVCDVRPDGKVRLGITAPSNINILREEVRQRNEQETSHVSQRS